MKNIPVNEPLVAERELEYVTDAIRSKWISSAGKYIDMFQKGFADYSDRKYGIAVNNGTNALVLAVRALGLPEGSEIIIPSFTIISCALACVYNGIVPVFVDSEEETWNMDVERIEEKITSKTRAIMAVHIYGHPCDIEGILRIADKHDLYVIEDFAEAIGSEVSGKICGSFGDISCVSFYANKTITTGEGGMCLTNDIGLSEKLQSLKNLSFLPHKRFIHEELGFNFRMTNIQAALGLAQLEKIEDYVSKKIWVGEMYNELLEFIPAESFGNIPMQKAGNKNTYWMYGIVLDPRNGLKAYDVSLRLKALGVDTRPFFYPLHMQPAFDIFSWHSKEYMPVSEKLYKYGFYLPSGLAIEEEDIEYVAECLKKILESSQ